jgi:hypothetical protein
MTTSLRAGVIAVAATAVGLTLAACGGSDSSGSASSQDKTTSSSAAAASTSAQASPSGTAPGPAPAAGAAYTIVDYIRDNKITETPIKPGTPGAPTVTLPIPPGWADAGDRAPEWSYRALVLTDPAMADNPPTITAIMSKLTGNVDPAEVLKAAPGEVKNLPGYENMGDGKATDLAGFDAYQIGGAYTKDGAKRLVAQKTVVIPTADAVYVLQINAEGTEDHIGPLMDATAAIDDQTTITV